jgi:predicted dehydrogenase
MDAANSLPSSPHMKITRWGLIGPGNIAKDFARDLQFVSTPQRIQAVLGDDWSHTQNFAKEFNVPQVFFDLETFIENADIDIVYITTPHTLHKVVRTCLENKIPVLCEKPMSINAGLCSELITASRNNNAFLMEGMWIRFLPSIKLLLQIVESGKIGRILSLKASISSKAPSNAHNRSYGPGPGSSSSDLGIYPVFLALLLLGKPNTIKAIGTISQEGVDEDCSVLFHYKAGQHAVLESSLVSQTAMTAEITGEKGTIKIFNPWFEKAAGLEMHVYDEGRIIYPCQWPGRGLQFEIEEALTSIHNNKISSDLLSHNFSRDLITVMDEVRDQIKVTYDMYE